jgi:hypothetical protein
MQLKSIPLCSEYAPEFLDPYHRVISVSAPLYQQWNKLVKVQKISAEFASWIENNYKSTFLDRNAKVRYIENKQELEQYLVHVVAGIAMHKTIMGYGQEIALTCGTSEKGIKYPMALVITADTKKLYAIQMQIKNTDIRVHHSSLVAGKKVAFAAEAFVKDGKFILITDLSGHYKPNLYSFVSGLNYMQRQGIDLSKAKIQVTRRLLDLAVDNEQIYENADEFIKLYAKNGFKDKDYLGMQQSVNCALKHFISKKHEDCNDAVYFIKEKNELYKITHYEDGRILVKDFNEIYKQNMAYKSAENKRFGVFFSKYTSPIADAGEEFTLRRKKHPRVDC